MDIIKEFQKYPHAWGAFMEWKQKTGCGFNWCSDAVTDIELRYLLADMQAWLDSVGIRAYYTPYYEDNLYRATVMVKDFEDELLGMRWASQVVSRESTSPTEALHAAINKALEIFEHTKQ